MQKWFNLLMLFFLTETCIGNGIISIFLKYYNNPGGKDNNGKCCELLISSCRGANPCDHYFKICIDNAEGSPTDMNQCSFRKTATGVIRNRNEIYFGDIIGETTNPVEVSFKEWPGSVLLKVEVWDDDGKGSGDDLVEQMTKTFSMEASRSRAEKNETFLRIKKRTQLDLKISVFCDENWYGPKCNVHCVPSEQSGHYNCEYDSGSKICLEGPGLNCTENIDDCVSGPCSILGGQCVDKINGYICECEPGHTGSTCETGMDNSSCTKCDNDGTGSLESQTGNISGIVSTVVLLIVVITLMLWKIYHMRQKQQNGPQNDDHGLNDDMAVYFTAQPVQYQHLTEDNIYYHGDTQATTDTDAVLYDNPAYGTGAANVYRNTGFVNARETQAHTENDTYIIDNPVYETSAADLHVICLDNTSGNSFSCGQTKSRDEIDTVEYTNAICVKNTGDVYAVVNK